MIHLSLYITQQTHLTHPHNPLILTGTEQEILADFRRVRELIRQRMFAYAKTIFECKDIKTFKP